MTKRRDEGTNPRATGDNPRASQPSRTATEILELVKTIDIRTRETQRVVGLIADRLNISLVPPSAHKASDGVRHLPGSQPFGTTTPEDPESDPIPGAGPSTARQALNGGLDGPTAAVIQIDQNSRNNHPTHRKDQS